MKNKDNNLIVIQVSQAFLPGGGGLEVVIDQIIKETLKRTNINMEVICIKNTNLQDGIVDKFDKEYIVDVFRAKNIFFNITHAFTRKYTSVTSVGDKVNFIGKIGMVFVPIVSIISLFVLLTKRIFAHKQKQIILHAHSMISAFLAVILKKMLFWKDIKVFFTVHFQYNQTNFIFLNKVINFCFLSSNKIFCVSNAVFEALKNNFYEYQHMTICNNWIDDDVLQIVNHKHKNKKDQIRLLSVGRIVPEKGIQAIMNLAKYIDENNLSKKYLINIIGDSTHIIKDKLTIFAKESKALSYLGRVNKPELWKYYLDADIFLMITSLGEGLGLVVIESYAFGVPVVGTKEVLVAMEKFKYHKLVSKKPEPEIVLEKIEKLLSEIKHDGFKNTQNSIRNTVLENFSSENSLGYINAYRDYA